MLVLRTIVVLVVLCSMVACDYFGNIDDKIAAELTKDCISENSCDFTVRIVALKNVNVSFYEDIRDALSITSLRNDVTDRPLFYPHQRESPIRKMKLSAGQSYTFEFSAEIRKLHDRMMLIDFGELGKIKGLKGAEVEFNVLVYPLPITFLDSDEAILSNSLYVEL